MPADDKPAKPERDYRAYPIVWARLKNILNMPKLRKSEGEAWLGICGYSKRVCKLKSRGDMLSVMVIQNLYIENGQCEEREGCLDFDCPLNRTTWESYQKREGLPKRVKRPANFGKQPMDFNASPDGGLHDFSWVLRDVEGKTHGGILEFNGEQAVV